MNRRGFLGVAACGLSSLAFSESDTGEETDLPRVDLHVHLDDSTIDKVLALSKKRNVKFGIVEHAGTKENRYPVVLSNDEELKGYLGMLEGKPVYKGVQAEWPDWMSCFSKEVVMQLDYVLTDAWTMRGPKGERMKLWEKGATLGEAEAFMDRYVDWHVEIIEKEPIDILANGSWIPGGIDGDYDVLWTDARIQKVIDALLKHEIALEINAGFRLPKLRFLRVAKDAGLQFSFGTNGRYPKMGRLDYALDMAKALELTRRDIFIPGQRPKAVARRWK